MSLEELGRIVISDPWWVYVVCFVLFFIYTLLDVFDWHSQLEDKEFSSVELVIISFFNAFLWPWYIAKLIVLALLNALLIILAVLVEVFIVVPVLFLITFVLILYVIYLIFTNNDSNNWLDLAWLKLQRAHSKLKLQRSRLLLFIKKHTTKITRNN